MLSTIKEETNGTTDDDITFIIQNDNQPRDSTLTYYSCISSIFKEHSPIFNKLIEKYRKKNKNAANEIFLKHMTLNSFCFIRNTFYDLNPALTYQDVVDILYSSIKYSIKPIIKQCNSFLLHIDNLTDYWIVIKSFSQHSKVLFESFFNKFTSKSEFFSNHIDEIVSDVKFITYSSLFEVEMICQYVLSEELMDHQSCYEIITKWCRWQYNNKFKPLLLIKNDDGEISTFTIDHEQVRIYFLFCFNSLQKRLFFFVH